MKTIDDLLKEVVEDKVDNLSTTSFKFKKDLWEFFEGDNEDSEFKKLNSVEFGTHKGQTTRILSYLFSRVYTVNLPKHFDEAQRLNFDRQNIEYVGMDLYQTPVEKNFKHLPVSVFFIDAVHTFDAVMEDVTRSLNFNLEKEVYFVFGDYGCIKDVFYAVGQLIRIGKFEKIKYIGHEPGFNFGGSPNRILYDWEGIICKLNI